MHKKYFSTIISIFFFIICSNLLPVQCENKNSTLYPFASGGTFYGIINNKGKMILPLQYNYIEYPTLFNGKVYIAAMKGGYWGIVDGNGKDIIKFKYKCLEPISYNGLIGEENENGKWGYININENLIIKPSFDSVGMFYDGMAVIKLGSKYGYINEDGKIIIKPIYDYASQFVDGIALVKNKSVAAEEIINKQGNVIKMDKSLYYEKIDSKTNIFQKSSENIIFYNSTGTGLKDSTNKILIQPGLYSGILDLKNGFYKLENGTLCGVADSKGTILYKPQFKSLLTTDSGYIIVTINNTKYGYIDETGKIIVKPIYDNARYFSDGLAAVAKDGAWGYINENGITAIDCSYAQVSDFNEGYAYVSANNNSGYFINKAEKMMTFPNPIVSYMNGLTYSSQNFSDGLAAFFDKDKNSYGFINKDFKTVIQAQFSYAFAFNEGLSAVITLKTNPFGYYVGYIDKTGTYVIKPKLLGNDFFPSEFHLTFQENLAPATDGKLWGYIDKTGKYVIKPQFKVANEFSDGLAAVEIGNKFGYINKLGKIIIQPQFAQAHNFSNDRALVMNSSIKYGYIDKSGKTIVNFDYDNGGDFIGDITNVTLDYFSGEKYIDRQGNIINIHN